MSKEIAGIIAISIFILLCILQIILAAGAPIGQISWGGKYEGKLPKKMRIGSLIAVGIFTIMIIVVLDRAEIAEIFPGTLFATILVWIFAFYTALNTLGNLASRSKLEKMIMTPLSLTACVCLFIVAI